MITLFIYKKEFNEALGLVRKWRQLVFQATKPSHPVLKVYHI
jgi:hypothetical protein